MQTLKRIDPISAGKMTGFIAGVIGLIIGAFVSLFALMGASLGAAAGEGGGAAFMALFGAGAIVILPIVYGIFGFIGGAIESFIYNIAARFMGGIVIELE